MFIFLFFLIFITPICGYCSNNQSEQTSAELSIYEDTFWTDPGVRPDTCSFTVANFSSLEDQTTTLIAYPKPVELKDETDIKDAFSKKRRPIIPEPQKYPDQCIIFTKILFSEPETISAKEVHFTSFLVGKNLAITAAHNLMAPTRNQKTKTIECYVGKRHTEASGFSPVKYILDPPKKSETNSKISLLSKQFALKHYSLLVLQEELGEKFGFLSPTIASFPSDDVTKCSLVGYGTSCPSKKSNDNNNNRQLNLKSDKGIKDKQVVFYVHGKKSEVNSSFFIHTSSPNKYKGLFGSPLTYTFLDNAGNIIKEHIGFNYTNINDKISASYLFTYDDLNFINRINYLSSNAALDFCFSHKKAKLNFQQDQLNWIFQEKKLFENGKVIAKTTNLANEEQLNSSKLDSKFKEEVMKSNFSTVHKKIKSLNELALRYMKGNNVKKNPAFAIKLLKISANRGNSEAWEKLAECYLQGIGVQKNINKAFDHYSKAAKGKDGHIKSMYKLAKFYEKGIGTKKKFKEYQLCLVELHEKLAKEDQKKIYLMKAMFQLAEMYQKQGDEANTFKWIKNAAMANYKPAFYKLAKLYKRGKGTPKNLEIAFQWYVKAANEGHLKAMCKLAGCYHNSNFWIPKADKNQRKEKALHWLNLAKEKGHLGAKKLLDELKWPNCCGYYSCNQFCVDTLR